MNSKIVLAMVVSLTLVGCGGGSSSNSAPVTVKDTSTSNQNTQGITPRQNQYLPINNGDTLVYNASNLINWQLHKFSSTAVKAAENRYNLDYEVLTQVIETKEKTVDLVELLGQFKIAIGNNTLQVSRVVFSKPLIMLSTDAALDEVIKISETATVFAKLNGGAEKSYAFTVTGTLVNTKSNFTSGANTYPTLKSNMEYQLHNAQFNVDIDVIDNTSFIDDVGVAEKNMSVKYNNQTLNQFVINLDQASL